MRKFSKIFAVALTLCLLLGMIALSASAATATKSEKNAMLTTTDHAKSWNESFTDGSYSDTKGVQLNTGGGMFTATVKTATDGNKYIAYKNAGTNKVPTGSAYITMPGGWNPWARPAEYVNSSGNTVGANPYFISYLPADETVAGTELKGSQLTAITADFDFGSDMYAYEYEGATHLAATLEEIPEGATGTRLALDPLKNSSSAICVVLRSVTGSANGDSHWGWFGGFKCVNGTWYITANQDGSGTAIELSNVAGVFDHLSVIMYPGTSKGVVTVEAYVNGEFLVSRNFGSSANPYVYFDEIRISYTTAQRGTGEFTTNSKGEKVEIKEYYAEGSNANLPHSLACDNYSVNYYGKDYVSETGFGLDDYIAQGATKTQQFYECVDVVYNADYVQPGKGWVSADNGTTKCYVPALFNKALASLSNEGTLVLNGAHVENYIPASSVETFYVKLENGSTFSLDSSVAGNFVPTEDTPGTTIYAPAAATQKATIVWVDDAGVELFRSEIAVGNTPDPSNVPYTPSIDYATGIYKNITGWKWDPDGETFDAGEGAIFGNTYGEIDLCELTQEMLDSAALVNTLGGGDGTVVYTIKATMAESKVGFVTLDADGNGYIPTGLSIDSFSELTAAKIASALSKVTSGSTFKFFDNDGTNDNTVVIETVRIADLSKANFEYNFDLNGLTVIQYGIGNYTGAWFDIKADGVKITIYNGSIFQTIDNSGDAANRLHNSDGLVWVAGTVDKCELNFGSPDGQKPLNFYGGSLIYTTGTADKDEAMLGEGEIVTNVYGGTYLNVGRPAYFMFGVLSVDNKISIYNATLINKNTTSYGVFGNYPDQATKNQRIYCYDSTILALSPDASKLSNMFAGNLDSLYAYFEGCTIFANDKAAGGTASIILGKNNYVAGTIADRFVTDSQKETNQYHNFDEGIAYVTSGVDKKVTVNYPAAYIKAFTSKTPKDPTDPMYDISTVDFTYPVQIVTYEVGGELPEGVVKVDFSLDGSTVAGSIYAVAGGKLVSGPEGVALPTDILSLNNGWYDLAYRWGQSSNGSTDIFESGNLFVPIQDQPVANIQGVKLNMSLWTHYSINLYIPTPAEGSGVTVDNFYETNGDLVGQGNVSKDVTVNGVKYALRDMVYSTLGDFNNRTRVVRFTVEREGKVYTLNQKFTYNPLDYAMRVVNTPAYECGSDALKLVYNMVQYMDVAGAYYSPDAITAKRAAIDAFYAKFEAHGASCTCKTDLNALVFSAEENAINADSYAGLSEVVESVTYAMQAQKPSFQLTLKALEEGQTAKVSVYAYDEFTEKNYSYITKTVNYGDSYVINSGSIFGYTINKVMTIEVTIGETTYTGQYCLAEYIELNPTVDAAKAFWAYSKSAYDFKLITPEEE